MASTRDDAVFSSSLGRVMYYLALLLIVTPAVDFIANVLPIQFGQVQWRYGTVGLLSGFLLTPVLGLVLAILTAAALRHAVGLRFLGFFALFGALVLLAASASFVLDVLQVRSSVPADARPSFHTGSLKALAKHLSTVVGLAWLGIATLKAARTAQARNRRLSEESPILVQREGK